MTTYRHDDPETVLRAAGGDLVARRYLMNRYDPLVCSVTAAHRIEGDDAYLVSIHTWTAIFDALPGFRRSDTLASWVVEITRRECRRQLAGGPER